MKILFSLNIFFKQTIQYFLLQFDGENIHIDFGEIRTHNLLFMSFLPWPFDQSWRCLLVGLINQIHPNKTNEIPGQPVAELFWLQELTNTFISSSTNCLLPISMYLYIPTCTTLKTNIIELYWAHFWIVTTATQKTLY